ncbi:hypothetical protein AVEN_75210-1 [Araneus ventricosus]|uniref:Uncharacterized protein n=1 Tax=Araneus ventricosus TaxID=182803 RepID=A0A4Y2WMR7_ARAVE|nr:hypothetical protein AVEN_75210-1 [Araneus ventricosus]
MDPTRRRPSAQGIKCPTVHSVHIPATSNRILKEDFPTIKELAWNYTEAGRGKGAPYGVGGVIKRSADRLVAQGKDIENFKKNNQEFKIRSKGSFLTHCGPKNYRKS